MYFLILMGSRFAYRILCSHKSLFSFANGSEANSTFLQKICGQNHIRRQVTIVETEDSSRLFNRDTGTHGFCAFSTQYQRALHLYALHHPSRDMSILVAAQQVDFSLWGALCDSQMCYLPRYDRLPRSVWCNQTSLPRTHIDPCRLAIEAAESDLNTLNRLLGATSRGLREWWQGVGRNGSIVMTVKEGFRVKLPLLPDRHENVTLEPMQSISIESLTQGWTVRVRVGLGYVLARAMGECLGQTVKSGKRGKAIMKMNKLVMDCLRAGRRLFEIEERAWTKEIKSLVHSKWGWQGVFQIREDNAASRANHRCVVILFDPARITDYNLN